MVSLGFEGFAGVRLAAEEFGSPDNPAILLVHGGAQSHWVWRHTVRGLEDAGRYVISLDLRGHGESDWAPDGRYDLDAYARDIRAVLADMPSRPIVVGSTLGAMAAMAALEGTGDRLASGLILIEPGPWTPTSRASEIEAEMRRQAEGFDTLEDVADAVAVSSSARRSAPPNLFSVRKRVVKHDNGRYYWRWDPRTIAAFSYEGLEDRVKRAASRITVPTLVLTGGKSDLLSLEDAEELTAILPAGERQEVAGAGHLAMIESADALSAVLVEFLERHAPRDGISHVAGTDPRILRDALGCFGTGITVVTSVDENGAPIGLTANSFTSVSLDPPLILFCLANTSSNLETFKQQPHFAINVLHMGQQPTSAAFARRSADRFASGQWETWDAGVPILKGALAAFECAKHEVIEAGDHHVVIGRVLKARFEPRRDPLFYFRGKYRRLHFS